MDQMYKKLDDESLVDQKLNEWKNSLPANRDQRRYQIKKYKYYLELNEDGEFWSVFGVKKNGTKFLIDQASNHIPKNKPKLVEPNEFGVIGGDDDDEEMVLVQDEVNADMKIANSSVYGQLGGLKPDPIIINSLDHEEWTEAQEADKLLSVNINKEEKV